MTAAAARTILAIAYFFPPLGGGGVQRTVQFLKHLRPLGWRSEVVTGRAADYWVLDPSLAAQVPPDTVVHRTRALTGHALLGRGRRPGSAPRPVAAGPGAPPAPAVRSTRFFARLRRLSSSLLVPDAYVGWFPFALAAARARLVRGGVDILFTTSSPDTAHLVGLVLRERFAIPWVADFRDPWVRRLTFTAPTRFHRCLHQWLERRVLERADRVVVTNEATRDDFLARHAGIPAARFAVIPNGYDPEDIASLREYSRERAAAPAGAAGTRRLVLAHTGLLSGKRTLAPLTAALGELFSARPDLRSRLAVRQIGPRENVNDELVAAAGLADVVEFAGPVDHARVLVEMAAADILLLLEADEPAGSLITPGKIFEYLASGRPLLALVPEGPAATLVRAAGGGAVVAPRDAAGAAEVLARWLDHGLPAPPPRAELLAPYARPALAAQLAALLDELTASG
jgi:glycosyltransferase involved in cell wall biosynthesis